MDELTVIKIMNEAKIKVLQKKNEDSSKNEKLKEILNDQTLFFKISKERAFQILNCVGVKNTEMQRVYNKLITYETYIKLVQIGKIDSNDPNIKIKYKYNK